MFALLHLLTRAINKAKRNRQSSPSAALPGRTSVYYCGLDLIFVRYCFASFPRLLACRMRHMTAAEPSVVDVTNQRFLCVSQFALPPFAFIFGSIADIPISSTSSWPLPLPPLPPVGLRSAICSELVPSLGLIKLQKLLLLRQEVLFCCVERSECIFGRLYAMRTSPLRIPTNKCFNLRSFIGRMEKLYRLQCARTQFSTLENCLQFNMLRDNGDGDKRGQQRIMFRQCRALAAARSDGIRFRFFLVSFSAALCAHSPLFPRSLEIGSEISYNNHRPPP